MAIPTSVFRDIPQSTAASALNSPALRKGTITSEHTVSTGDGNECDFGTVDISGGANNSNVRTMLWHISADGGNTLAEDFRLWCSSLGFDQTVSGIKFASLSGTDQLTPVNTQNYSASAGTGTYTYSNMREPTDSPVMPTSANLYPTDPGSSPEVSSMVLSTTSDDALMWALYCVIATGETTGTYKGTTANYQLQFSFRYTYS